MPRLLIARMLPYMRQLLPFAEQHMLIKQNIHLVEQATPVI